MGKCFLFVLLLLLNFLLLTHSLGQVSTLTISLRMARKLHYNYHCGACVDTPRSRFVTWLQSNPHAIHFKRPKTRRIMRKLEGAANGQKKVRKWYAFLMTCLFSVKFVQMKVFIRLGASENEQYSIQFGGCIVHHMVSEREKNQKEI